MGDVSNLPFEDESFDTIFATDLLEHLDDETLHKGLEEIGRVLKSGGAVIITVPYKEYLRQDMVLCPKCGAKFNRWGHMQVFDERRMREMLQNWDFFEIIKTEILPIGFVATHRFLKYFRIFLNRLGYLKWHNLFVVVVKR